MIIYKTKGETMGFFDGLRGPPNVEKLYKKGDIEGLINALEYYRMWEVRKAAAKALGELRDPRAIEPLINALNDPFGGVRETVAYALGNIDDSSAVYTIINALKSDDKYFREGAAKALGNRNAEEAVSSLIYALNDTYCEVQISAAESLGKIESFEAIEPLADLLNKKSCAKKDIYVKEVVAEALGNIGDKKAVEPLVMAMKISCIDPTLRVDETTLWDNAADLRDKTAEALLKIGDTDAVELLIENLKSENIWIKESTAVLLGNMRDKRALDPLSELLNDNDAEIREIAAEAIETIENQ